MGRWFRRKDKDRKKSRAESEAALEESQAATGEVLEQAEEEPRPSLPEDVAQETPAEVPEEASNEGHGTFFSPEPNDEVLVAFESGDPREPNVIGGLWDGSDKPPTDAPKEPHHGFFARFRQARPAEEPEMPATELAYEPSEAEAAPPEPDLLPQEPPEDLQASEDQVVEEGEALELRSGMFRRLRERLSRTRETLAGGLDRLFAGRKEVDAALLEELEEVLITADIGVETTLALIQALHEKLRRRELADVERLKAVLKAEMVALLTAPPPPSRSARPWVVLVVGINGVGKTTTIAKLAHRDRARGLTPMLVAADTFRAAAVEQLEIWGERVGAAVIKQKTGADPAAVVFDGLAAAQSRGVDTVYVDTAGRLHTKVNLMEELKKIHRTAAKKLPGAPQEIFLVLDATTGQNALSQARLFHEAVGLTGLVLTKMDGTAKGGVALGVVHETGIPLRYIGVGEAMEDLRPFDAEAFVEAILG